MTTQLFSNRLHLARGHPLHIHLRQCSNQRLLTALEALEQRRRELPVAISRHSQLDLADPRDQAAAVVAGAIASALLRALASARTEQISHLALHDLLQRFLRQRLEQIPVLRHQSF
jgi:hypothetical protein